MGEGIRKQKIWFAVGLTFGVVGQSMDNEYHHLLSVQYY